MSYLCARCGQWGRAVDHECVKVAKDTNEQPAAVASDAQGIPLRQSARDRTTFWVWDTTVEGVRKPPTHVAHALDAASVAARRQAVAQAMSDLREHMSPTLMTFAVPTFQQYADAVLKALGLDGQDA